MTDHLSTWHFAPTAATAANLRHEGLGPGSIRVTGNTVVDAIMHVHALVRRDGVRPPVLLRGGPVITVTAHRRENFGEPLFRICRALRTIVDDHPDVQIVFPGHPNPNVRSVV